MYCCYMMHVSQLKTMPSVDLVCQAHVEALGSRSYDNLILFSVTPLSHLAQLPKILSQISNLLVIQLLSK